MRVSAETDLLDKSSAFVHDLVWRKMVRSPVGPGGVEELRSARMEREALSREPI